MLTKLPKTDPRVQPTPADQYKEIRSVRLSDHRYQQLKAEVEATELARQDVIDIALGEYFAARYAERLQ